MFQSVINYIFSSELIRVMDTQTVIIIGEIEFHHHPNGGGLVASTANVDETVHVGPFACVIETAHVRGKVKILDSARIGGDAEVSGQVVIKGSSIVSGAASIKDFAVIQDKAEVFGGKISGHVNVRDNAKITFEEEPPTLTDEVTVQNNAIIASGNYSGKCHLSDDKVYK